MAEGTRRLAAIMFTDMVGYTALSQSDETLALGLLQTQKEIVLPLVGARGGTAVKTIGDAHLIEFGSAFDAVRCAVEIQRRMKAHADSALPEQGFKLRIGVHVGDVVHKEGDVFGDAVNIASRIEPLAEPGGVCISQQVYDQVRNKVDFEFEKLPLRQLKNVSARIEVYRVVDTEPSQRDGRKVDQPRDRVAVLPLSNFSPSPKDEYLADGMTEELITAISGVRGLRVIARTSVMRFKNSDQDVGEIGRALGVGTILGGSFRKLGEKIRVTVQLIDAKTEEHILASNYDGDLKDIFAIQSDIANKVAQALKLKLIDRPVRPASPADIEAYELYLKGRYFWNRRTKEGVGQALKLFESAVAKDPHLAKAYSGIADCYLVGTEMDLFQPEEADTGARGSIQKALELDDSIPEAHASLGLLLRINSSLSESEAEFKKALSLNESYASAHHWYAITLAELGRLDEAIQQATLASQCDPLSAPALNILGVMYVYARQFDKALEVFGEVLRTEPGFGPGLGFRAQVYIARGMENEAMRDLSIAFRDFPEHFRLSFTALAKAWLGHEEEARKLFEEAERIAPERALPSMRAGFSAALGDADGFFKWIGPAMESKEVRPQEVRYALYLDKVRGDPRFADLLKKLPA